MCDQNQSFSSYDLEIHAVNHRSPRNLLKTRIDKRFRRPSNLVNLSPRPEFSPFEPHVPPVSSTVKMPEIFNLELSPPCNNSPASNSLPAEKLRGFRKHVFYSCVPRGRWESDSSCPGSRNLPDLGPRTSRGQYSQHRRSTKTNKTNRSRYPIYPDGGLNGPISSKPKRKCVLMAIPGYIRSTRSPP